jgi:hypothetical protein
MQSETGGPQLSAVLPKPNPAGAAPSTPGAPTLNRGGFARGAGNLARTQGGLKPKVDYAALSRSRAR